MTYWLKAIGTHDEPVDVWDEPYVQFSGAGGVPQIKRGDEMILYASRHGTLFAIATALSGPQNNVEVRDQWGEYQVKVDYELNLPVSHGVAGTAFTPPIRFYGGGHKRLSPEVFNDAAKALRKLHQKNR